ncbi:dienelactone hydrolase family protein [Novosphingobium resinovorum]|nr:dienelactone hydrolase family protein [Novosphingobium resinovorum]
MCDPRSGQAGLLHAYSDGDVTLHGEIFPPVGAGNGRAALIVHEADGIGGNVRRHARILAELAYFAFAADMHGAGAVLEGEAIHDALKRFRAEPDRLRSRVQAALAALSDISGLEPEDMVGLGYCFGGFCVLELARSGVPVRAVASFHGLLNTSRPASRDTLKARIAVFTGGLDPLVPPDHIAAFQAEMPLAAADWQLGIYGRALHSFTNSTVDALGDPTMGYHAEADESSWAAMLRFFDISFKRSDRGDVDRRVA